MSTLGSVLPTPRESPANPGVKGTPVVASNTPPSCQPLSAHTPNPIFHLGAPSTQVYFTFKLWLTLSSARPRFKLRSKNSGLEMEFVYSSPTMLPEPVSMVLPQV